MPKLSQKLLAKVNLGNQPVIKNFFKGKLPACNMQKNDLAIPNSFLAVSMFSFREDRSTELVLFKFPCC